MLFCHGALERTGDCFMNKIALFIRKITIPPVFAVVLLCLVYFINPAGIGSVWAFLAGILFLAGLPTLAYPLQKHMPYFKDKGREGQRSLAMLFSFAGYLLGTIVSFAFPVPTELKGIFLEYLFCGISMLVLNKVFKLKASGHACGVVGPVIMMIYLGLYVPSAICALFTVPVFVSSIQTKRHTPLQLLGGSLIPVAMLVIVHLIMK